MRFNRIQNLFKLNFVFGIFNVASKPKTLRSVVPDDRLKLV